jgi:hypothetical protein
MEPQVKHELVDTALLEPAYLTVAVSAHGNTLGRLKIRTHLPRT